MLRLQATSVYYGAIRALVQVGLAVEAGEIVALIGANGAGKTTCLKTIAGLLRPRRGDVIFKGESLTSVPAYTRARRGIVLVPEGRGILTGLTVHENLLLGASVRGEAAGAGKRADAILERFPRLATRRDLPASVLSGGERQILAIARALLAQPELLLVDEPSLGLAPRAAREVFDLLASLRQEGRAILLVEQNARIALDLADRAYVLQTGRVVLTGTSRDLLADRRVQAAYLGINQ
jgi:branched-chain amino acid transport system ATP-binding protein